MHSAPLPLLPVAPPTCLSCSLLASLLCPQDQPSPEGTSEGVGPGPRARQTSPADWAGKKLGALPPDLSPPRVPPGMGTPPPSQPPLRGTGPVQPPLLLPPQSPYILLVPLGVLPISLGVGVPHHRPAATLVVGRREFCVFPHRHLDSAPP